MASWIWGTSQFDEEVDKATSELLPSDQEDIALNLEICDQIKAKMVQPKDAMRALKRRLNHKNPNVQLLALTLTDICVKNGGNHFLMEISSREFMDNLVSIVKIVALNNDVKNRLLRFIQNWAVAFEGKPEFSYVNTVYKQLVSEGYKFPPKDLAIANNAMTDTAIAPEWIDSDVCLRCRDSFTFTNRKHHCRNCGQVFDQKCSSKTLPLPHFGIPQEVRVCDSCHFKLIRKKEAAAKEAEDAHKKGLRQQIRHEVPDYDLARAIELSLKESRGSGRAGYAPLNEAPKQWATSEPPLVQRTERMQGEDDDEDLRAAIEASLREAHAPQPSAPVVDPVITNAGGYDSPIAMVPSYDLAPMESDAIMSFNQTVAEAQTYGMRDLRQTHDLYRRATASQPKLTRSLDDTEKKEQLLSEMHEKLSQAVKLYDNLLTEQFTQTSRRQQALSQPSYPQYNPYQQPQQPLQHPQQQWTNPQAVPTSPYQGAHTAQPVASPPASEQNWAQNSMAYRAQANPPSPMLSRAQYGQDYVAAQPSPAITQSAQYSMQQQPVYAPSLPPVTLPLSPGLNHNSYQPNSVQQPALVNQPPAPVSATPVPTAPQQQPPSAQRAYQSYHAPSHSLSRSNTINTPVHAQPPQVSYANHPHYQQQQHAPPQQQHRVAPAPAPVTMPILPTAPTNAPSAYPLYGPSAAVPSVPASEPKEAMLISFDWL